MKKINSLIQQIKDRYLITKQLISISAFGFSLLIYSSSGIKPPFFEDQQNLIISKYTFFAGVTLLIVFGAIPVLLESFAWLIPFGKSFWNKLVSLFSSFISILKFIYIQITKFFIGPVIREIINENLSGQKIDFIFQKQQTDDHYYPDIFNFNNKSKCLITVVPDKQTIYWRFGVKFSRSTLFCDNRHGVDFPLLHLTKNSDEKCLRVTYYDQTGTQVYNEIIIDTYLPETEITLSVEYINNGGIISIYNHERVLLKKQGIGSFPFGKLFAWGDRNDFKIETKIS